VYAIRKKIKRTVDNHKSFVEHKLELDAARREFPRDAAGALFPANLLVVAQAKINVAARFVARCKKEDQQQ